MFQQKSIRLQTQLLLLFIVMCGTQATPPQLLLSNRIDIRILNSVVPDDSASTATRIVIDDLQDAAAVDYLYSEQLIFWTDVSAGKIKRTSSNGSQIEEDVISTRLISPDGLACDWVGKKIYWTDAETDRIEVSELDGRSRKVLYWQDLDKPRAIVVHPERGFLFWTDWGETPKIERAGMDGSDKYRMVIIDRNIEWPNGLTLDYDASKLYWLDAKYQYIHRCDFDGENRVEVLQGSLRHPFALTLFDGTLFWTDWETRSVHSCKYDGKDSRIVYQDAMSPMDIKSFSSLRQKEVSTPCAENNGGCSHLCLISPDPPNFACACPTGVQLLADGVTCADGAKEFLILLRRTEIWKISLDTADYTEVVIPLDNIQNAVAIDYDPVEDYIYWTDDDVNAIRRAKLDGSGSEYIVTSDLDQPDGIAIDVEARNLYWTDAGTNLIEVARLNGTARKTLVSKDLDEPRAIAVDPILGFMFWSDWGEAPKIERAYLDGSGRSVLVNTYIGWPNGLAIDRPEGKIYWGDAREDKIEVMDLDGQNRRVLVEEGIPHIFGFSLLGKYIYWTDWQRRTVERVNKHTGEERRDVVDRIPDVMGLTANSVSVNQTDHNPCADSNGGCSHLCFYLPSGVICSCPSNYELLADQRTCTISDAFMVFSKHGGIRRRSLEPSRSEVQILLPDVKKAWVLDYDFEEQRIYWTDTDAKTISRGFLNGSGIENVIEFRRGTPGDIAVDWIARNIYFTNSGTGRVEVARLDGSARRVLVWEGVQSPRSIALHLSDGYMYWSDFSRPRPKIERAYLDGTDRSVIYRGGRANGLTIDYNERRLYWVSLGEDTIESADLLGGDRRSIDSDDIFVPRSLVPHQDFIYWSDSAKMSIERADKATGHNRTLMQGDRSIVRDIIVYSRQQGWNQCADDNGGCQYLCLAHQNDTSGQWDYVCECPDHYTLNEDEQTCEAPNSFLLFSNKNSISRLAADDVKSPDITLPITNENIQAIEYDTKEKRVYWIERRSNTVQRSYENGTEPEVFISNPGGSVAYIPYDMAIDPYTRTLFWTCRRTNTIRITRLDGTSTGVVIDRIKQRPRAIALLPEKSLMFWTNIFRGRHRIEKAFYDGTEYSTLFQAELGEIGPIATDPASETLFWVNNKLKRIESVHISGSNHSVLVANLTSTHISVTVLGDYLYWADEATEVIARVNKVTGSDMQIVKNETKQLTDIQAVGTPFKEDYPCLDDNGGCSHICINMGYGLSRCSCPLGLDLHLDGRTCEDLPTCSPQEFTCRSDGILCIPLSWRCDSEYDCNDHSDEEDCH